MAIPEKQPDPPVRLHSPVVRCAARLAGCTVPNGLILDSIPVTITPADYAVRHAGWVRYPRAGRSAVACPGCAAAMDKAALLAGDDDSWPTAFGGKGTFSDVPGGQSGDTP